MGDLGQDTAPVARGDGRYRVDVRPDWEIWGPMGGYVAACALRAVGEEAGDHRPAAFSCHYLGVASFAAVDVAVTARRRGRRTTAWRVELTQDGRAVLDAMAWSTAVTDGLEHDETTPPAVPDPDGLPSAEELAPGVEPPYPFWRNLDRKPHGWEERWPPDGPRPARWAEWLRFRPTATFPDPWVDAARTVILVDLPSWPAAHRPHAWRDPPYIAPTLDLNVAFHRDARDQPWLLCDGRAPVSTGGLFSWTAQVWSPGGRLHASGGGQCLYRRR